MVVGGREGEREPKVEALNDFNRVGGSYNGTNPGGLKLSHEEECKHDEEEYKEGFEKWLEFHCRNPLSVIEEINTHRAYEESARIVAEGNYGGRINLVVSVSVNLPRCSNEQGPPTPQPGADSPVRVPRPSA